MLSFAPMRLPLGYELVARAMHGAKMDGSRRVAFKFLTQPQDVIVYGARTGVVFVSPDFIKQLVAGNNAARVLKHVLESLELSGRERDVFAFADNFHRGKIDVNIPKAERTFRADAPKPLEGLAYDTEKFRHGRLLSGRFHQ